MRGPHTSGHSDQCRSTVEQETSAPAPETPAVVQQGGSALDRGLADGTIGFWDPSSGVRRFFGDLSMCPQRGGRNKKELEKLSKSQGTVPFLHCSGSLEQRRAQPHLSRERLRGQCRSQTIPHLDEAPWVQNGLFRLYDMIKKHMSSIQSVCYIHIRQQHRQHGLKALQSRPKQTSRMKNGGNQCENSNVRSGKAGYFMLFPRETRSPNG